MSSCLLTVCYEQYEQQNGDIQICLFVKKDMKFNDMKFNEMKLF